MGLPRSKAPEDLWETPDLDTKVERIVAHGSVRAGGAVTAATTDHGGERLRIPGRARVSAMAVTVAFVAGLVGLAWMAAPAVAEGDEDGQEVEIVESALYAAPVTEAIPDTLTSEVPPTALCVLEPTLCPEESDEVRSLVRDVATDVVDEVPAEPVHPIPPDTVAVSYLGGNPRYQSAILFDVPAPPAGQEFVHVELVLPQTDPSYHLDSPSFRHVVLGTFAALGAQDPEILAEGVTEALVEQDLASTEQLLGIEACPFTAEFEPGGAPEAYEEEELPRSEDDEDAAAVDCLFGGDGIYDEDAQVWRFDITFAAQAWQEGDIANHGLLLSPSGAPNLAFGDPDSTTNAQVVLDITDARLSFETAEPPPPPGDSGLPGDGDGTTGDDGGPPPPSGSSSSGGPAPSTGGGGGGGGIGSAGGGGGGGDLGGADDGGFDEPVGDDRSVAADDDQDTEAMAVTDPGIQRPWWVWLLVPVFLGGAYLMHRSLLGSTTGANKAPRGALARIPALGRPARG